jgi:hypothetical protein
VMVHRRLADEPAGPLSECCGGHVVGRSHRSKSSGELAQPTILMISLDEPTIIEQKEY